ncbi:MAG: SIS domain-containing protein [Bacteroidales bacterium]|nr:SIS domain-containing protein [Bacteroidales bacterium]
MKYFDYDLEFLQSKGAIYTAREINDQPNVWKETYNKVVSEKSELIGFWQSAVQICSKIILTGAGTSAYIGLSLEGAFQKSSGITTVAIPTTHLITHPAEYFQANVPTLLVSFARSGNSPESEAAHKLADSLCEKVFHLVITCDSNGKLARYTSVNPQYTLVLPEDSNDKSLAMTSSYTNMLLAGLLIKDLEHINLLNNKIKILAEYGNVLISKFSEPLKKIAQLNFDRAVFLGSGPFYGTATESNLKLQELTDGNIVCKSDTFLAFRHGPKAVVNEHTIVVYFFSNNPYVYQYERDLVRNMQKGKMPMFQLGISQQPLSDIKLDYQIDLSKYVQELQIEDEYFTVCAVIMAQLLGFFKSLIIGLKPDNPSVLGAISRVVEGVVIYDLNKYSEINQL